ncbi:iron-sulfur cluster assembly scaffold protein [Lutispora sp.]|uniref:iron-sulfur cluster assembly scaffold protein n=1 Tax=Lutispora sp. TaxID=2828727 RepID=UPI00356363B7
MCDEAFSKTFMEHFLHPKNVGSMKNADGVGVCGDPGCGDALTLYIKVKDDVIDDISFLVYGCAAAIATSSMTTELIKGKTLDEASKLTDEDIAEGLGGLPLHKMHCSNLGAQALKNAINDYYTRKSK